MWLSVYVKNNRAIRFYQKNEFKNVGELNFLVNGKDYENIIILKKHIDYERLFKIEIKQNKTWSKLERTYDVDKINTILDAGFLGYVSYVYRQQSYHLTYGLR